MVSALLALVVGLLFPPASSTGTPPRQEAPLVDDGGAADNRAAPTEEAVRRAIRRGVEYLLGAQNADGSWGSPLKPRTVENMGWSHVGTHKAWIVATTGIACVTLLDLREEATPEARRALERGIDYIIANAVVKRISRWDVDNTWGYVYALEALTRALQDPGLRESRGKELQQAGRVIVDQLALHQTPEGGWAYYDDPPYTRRPTWSTSFTTAAGVLSLLEAKRVGIDVDDRIVRDAVQVLKHCRLPTGAYTYSVNPVTSPGRLTGIDQVKGSLSRIQVGNLALHRAGEELGDGELQKGLDQFFRHHRFLALGRGRPIPHEAYYAVAGYFFFFGHYYAAGVIEELPAEERPRYWRKLQEKVLETQEADGSMWDFHTHGYHRPYGTAWGVSVLQRSLMPQVP